MGTTFSTATSTSEVNEKPQDICEFRKLDAPLEHYDIPEVPYKRKATDKNFTIVFGVSFIILFIFLAYTLSYSNILRLTNGYDKCGNICGIKNEAVSGIKCSGTDETKYSYLTLKEFESELSSDREFIQDECVEKCPNNTVRFINRCFPNDDDYSSKVKQDEDLFVYLKELKRDINKATGYIIGICLFGLVMNVTMLFLFRYFLGFMIWFSITCGVSGTVFITCVLWYLSLFDSDQKDLLGVAIVFTIISVIVILLLIRLRKQIKLIMGLFKEAINILFLMPSIFFEPILTFFSLLCVYLLSVYIIVQMLTSGTLTKTGENLYDYLPDTVMLFTMFFTFVMTIWLMYFIIGCQHMVISGAVSAFYFEKDKMMLTAPVYNSFYNLVRYHLGTVAFGSLVITAVYILKVLLRSLARSKYTKKLIDCCFNYIERVLQYVSKNAYIQTAMHGQSFYESGKRAIRLLVTNALSTIAVNSIGDFILFLAKFWIILLTFLFGVIIGDDTIKNFWAAVLIGTFVTALLANSFFSVLETAVDTIFLCYCEDRTLNDGEIRAYYMTTDMMQVFEEMKAISVKA